MHFQEQWLNGSDDLTEAFSVRVEVFCDEQGFSPEIELDGHDPQCWHLIIREEQDDMATTPVATGRLYWTGGQKTVALGRIAVRKAWRGFGVGLLMMESMTRKARELGAKRVVLDSQCHAIGFYEKAGFTVCGEEHMDGHVTHKMMEMYL